MGGAISKLDSHYGLSGHSAHSHEHEEDADHENAHEEEEHHEEDEDSGSPVLGYVPDSR